MICQPVSEFTDFIQKQLEKCKNGMYCIHHQEVKRSMFLFVYLFVMFLNGQVYANVIALGF